MPDNKPPVTISMIVAASDNNAIGKNGQLLWHLPRDLAFFKNTTWGMPVIMGRKTFEAVNKPLPGRINIVITRDANWKAEGADVASSLNSAIEQAAGSNCKELFIIGGGQVYKESMDIADRIYITRIHGQFEGDAFFPDIPSSQWTLVHTTPSSIDEKNAFAMDFEIWERKKN